MTWVQRILEALEANLWKFIRVVHSANHDYPYHDYKEFDNSEGQEEVQMFYAVGTENVNAHGDQKKRFTSKRMLMWSLDDNFYVRLNHSNNVEIMIPRTNSDGTEGYKFHMFEFRTNIDAVYLRISSENTVYLYCEGVLPQEARDAE